MQTPSRGMRASSGLDEPEWSFPYQCIFLGHEHPEMMRHIQLVTDCTYNGVLDSCDIANGDAGTNGDGLPDRCACLADLDRNGVVVGSDPARLLKSWCLAGSGT